MFNIDEFRSTLSGLNEVSRADKFDVNITIPQSMLDRLTDMDTRTLSMLCDGSELPAREINMIEFRHYAFIRRIPHLNSYGLATFTFICTGSMSEKKFFDDWMDSMIPTSSGLVEYPRDNSGNPQYETTIDVNQYDMNGNMIYTATLVDAIPISISPLAQSWGDDSIHKLQVGFQFANWTSRNYIPVSPTTGVANKIDPFGTVTSSIPSFPSIPSFSNIIDVGKVSDPLGAIGIPFKTNFF